MSLPASQKANVVSLIQGELSQKVDEEGLTFPQAFVNLVLDYKGYEKDTAWREEHVSDGAKDFGIDFWDINSETLDVTLMQFKSFEEDGATIDESRKVAPDKIADLARIVDRLSDPDNVGVGSNAKTTAFLQRYNSLLHKMRGERDADDTRFVHARVTFCAMAGSLTAQAEKQFEDLRSRSVLNVGGVDVMISFDTFLIDDLIQEKWREDNTEWKDKDGKSRDTATLTVRGNVIEDAKSLVFFSKASDLVEMFEDYGYQIFEPNVRCEILKSKVNEAIRGSIATNRGRKEFKHLNNGLTIIAQGFHKTGKPIERIKITQPGVINGLQTLKSVRDAFHELDAKEKADFDEDCEILVRLHLRNAVGDYRNLVKSTNNQNPMLQRNLRANDEEQITYERLFAELGWFFERKEGAWAAFKSDSKRWGTLQGKTQGHFRINGVTRSVDNEQLGQCWLAYVGYSNEAVQKRSDLFGDDDLYEFVFAHVPEKHGSQDEFRLDVKESLLVSPARAPDPKMLLFSYILREVARKLAPSAKSHRDDAIKRLGLGHQTREKQNEELNTDRGYLKGVILRAVSYIFPEVVGYCMYGAYGKNFCGQGAAVLANGTAKRLFERADFNALKDEFEAGAWSIDRSDLLQTLWHLFDHLTENLIASNWREQWMMAPNRTRFNYGIATRQRLIKEIDELDKFVQQSQLIRQWAVGINESKGIYKYIRDTLSR